MTENVLVPSVEAISHQIDDRLFRELTAAFDSTQSPKELGVLIPKIIADNTGIVTEFFVEPTDNINAWVVPPDLNKNHPFIADWRREFATGGDAIKLMKTGKVNYLTGAVNRATSKVSGAFTKITMPIGITHGMLSVTHEQAKNSNLVKFTPAECAAAILHELGHIFSYYESLADALTTNWVLEAAIQAFFKTDDQLIRIRIVSDVEDALDISFNDASKVATQVTNPEAFYTVVQSQLATASASKLGANLYDLRSWESASDQFASRHGASLALATCLDKMSRVWGDDGRIGKIAHWVAQIIGTLQLIAVTVFLGTVFVFGGFFGAFFAGPMLIVMAMMAFLNPFEDIYDPHKLRLARIRTDVVSRLKKQGLPQAYVARAIKEFDGIEDLLKDINDHDSLWRKIWTFCSSYTRKQRSKISEQQELELLANNELFISSARFRVLV